MTKKVKPLRNGRSASNCRGWARAPVEMMESEAFQSLAASSHRVLLWCIWKNYLSATNRPNGETGKPSFRLTNSEARDKLRMNQQTFTRAKDELAEKGFLKWERRGGLRGVNGVASEFSLSGDWTHWRKAPK